MWTYTVYPNSTLVTHIVQVYKPFCHWTSPSPPSPLLRLPKQTFFVKLVSLVSTLTTSFSFKLASLFSYFFSEPIDESRTNTIGILTWDRKQAIQIAWLWTVFRIEFWNGQWLQLTMSCLLKNPTFYFHIFEMVHWLMAMACHDIIPSETSHFLWNSILSSLQRWEFDTLSSPCKTNKKSMTMRWN